MIDECDVLKISQPNVSSNIVPSTVIG